MNTGFKLQGQVRVLTLVTISTLIFRFIQHLNCILFDAPRPSGFLSCPEQISDVLCQASLKVSTRLHDMSFQACTQKTMDDVGAKSVKALHTLDEVELGPKPQVLSLPWAHPPTHTHTQARTHVRKCTHKCLLWWRLVVAAIFPADTRIERGKLGLGPAWPSIVAA